MWGEALGAASTLIGGRMAQKSNERINARQIEFQKNRLQHTVKDAKLAGLHPLFALGAGGASQAPQQIGDSMGSAVASAGAKLGKGISQRQQAGLQNRAIEAQIKTNEALALKYLAEAENLKPNEIQDPVKAGLAASLANTTTQQQNYMPTRDIPQRAILDGGTQKGQAFRFPSGFRSSPTTAPNADDLEQRYADSAGIIGLMTMIDEFITRPFKRPKNKDHGRKKRAAQTIKQELQELNEMRRRRYNETQQKRQKHLQR